MIKEMATHQWALSLPYATNQGGCTMIECAYRTELWIDENNDLIIHRAGDELNLGQRSCDAVKQIAAALNML